MIMITLMTCNSKKKDLCAPSCEMLLKIASLTNKHFSYYADWFDCYRNFNSSFSRYDWHNLINISLILDNGTIKLTLHSPKINRLALIQGMIISTAEAVSRMCSVNSILDNGTIKLTLRSPKINQLALIQGIVISTAEAVSWMCSVKNLFLIISKNSQENTHFLSKISFFNDVVMLRYVMLCYVMLSKITKYSVQTRISDVVKHLPWSFGENNGWKLLIILVKVFCHSYLTIGTKYAFPTRLNIYDRAFL